MGFDNVKPGDQLKPRQDLKLEAIYGGLTLWKHMYDRRGQTMTVKELISGSMIGVEENALIWTLEMFEFDSIYEPIPLSDYLFKDQ